MRIRVLTLAALGLVAVTASSCNLFDPFDGPTGDAQILSAARACLDKQDFACAREQYNKLSSAQADVATSELAFTTLNEAGVSFGAFITAFGDGDKQSGAVVTTLANTIGSRASEATRTQIFDAYKAAAAITNQELRGLTQFVASLALAAELLAEDSETTGNLRRADLASNPTTCQASAACAAEAACNTPSTGTHMSWDVAQGDVSLTTLTSLAGTRKLNMLTAAIKAAEAGLNEMSATGSGIVGFATSVLGQIASISNSNATCLRQMLLTQQVGG